MKIPQLHLKASSSDQGLDSLLGNEAGTAEYSDTEANVDASTEVNTEAGTDTQIDETDYYRFSGQSLSRALHIGYMNEEIIYQPDFDNQEQKIRLALWYPAQPDTGDGIANYPLFYS